ncbi:MAG: cell division protein [Candidatus Obscuribacterales bacterium]|nr:cell division protein [Steroidobacteraceae bacterium]
MKVFLTRHLQTLIGTLGRLSQQRVQTTMTVLVIGIALALPASLQMLILNARALSGDFNRVIELSVYLKPATTVAQAEQLATRVGQRRDVAQVKLVKADDALAEFRTHSGFNEALDALSGNPLPHALVVRPATTFSDSAQIDAIARDLKQLPEVEIVQLDTAWVERFNAMLDTVRRGVWVIGLLLAAAVAIIIGNTIRADIQGRRAEIEITKLVGGSDAFVRRPFLYTGIWYGLGGGLVALIIVLIINAALALPVQRLATLYGSNFQLAGLGLHNGLSLLTISIALGWLGSMIAATYHVRDVEPT